MRYRACIARTASNPEAARKAAELWLTKEGGVPAKHCLALALIALNKPAEGAQWLEEAERDMADRKGLGAVGAQGGPGLQAALLSQAANAWMMAQDYDRAYSALTDALAVLPVADKDKRIEVLSDRARALAAQNRWKDAIGDLGSAIALDDKRVELYVLRATAYRRLGEFKLADADLTRALALDGDNAAALLERGNLRRFEGNNEAARQDWERVIKLYPDSDEGKLARDDLSIMKGNP